MMRNPYHDFSRFDVLCQRYRQFCFDVDNGRSCAPYKDSVASVVNPYIWGKYHGFNIALTKQDMKDNPLFPYSEVWNGELHERKRRVKATFSKTGKLYRKKKGSPEYDESTQEWIYTEYTGGYDLIIDDPQFFMEYFREYRQFSAGLSHRQRQVIVVDFDDMSYGDDTIEVLEGICSTNGLPHFTYLERHLDSAANHFQIGWILDEPYHFWKDGESEYYRKMIRFLAALFEKGDMNYRGWWMKNPNCIANTETQWFNDTVSKATFEAAVEFIMDNRPDVWRKIQGGPRLDRIELQVEQNHKIRKVRQKEKEDVCVDETLLVSSRNAYLNKALREWLWEEARNREQFPSQSEAVGKALDIAKEAGRATGKGEQDYRETITTARAVHAFAKKNFSSKKQGKGFLLSDLVRRVQTESRRLLSYSMMKEGASVKEVAEYFGVHRNAVAEWAKGYRAGGLLEFYCPRLSYSLENWMHSDNFGRRKTGKVMDLIQLAQSNIDMFEELFANEIASEIEADALGIY